MNFSDIPSPALLVDADRVADNICSMIAAVGGAAVVDRLRPHVKTHKMFAVTQMQVAAGIRHFKAATLAEAAMVASAGGSDVLVAYPLVGPNLPRLRQLIERFPETSFAAIADSAAVAEMLGQQVGSAQQPLRVYIDVDCGMHRTGIALADSQQLRQQIESSPSLQFAGLHVYDGHLHQSSLDERTEAAEAIIADLEQYQAKHGPLAVIGGGSPTFPIWAAAAARHDRWQCSPGTPVFWDIGYGGAYQDLDYGVALALVTRVISKPSPGRICLDLGYKAVAAEMPLERRVQIPSLSDARVVGHSEEHLMVETTAAERIAIGEVLLVYPRHVCPTVALHAVAYVIRDGEYRGETWEVTARDR